MHDASLPYECCSILGRGSFLQQDAAGMSCQLVVNILPIAFIIFFYISI